jgi:hypothetical protein
LLGQIDIPGERSESQCHATKNSCQLGESVAAAWFRHEKLPNLDGHSYCTNRKTIVNKSDREFAQLSSHPATALIELVAIYNRLDVLPRSGKIDVLEEFLH